VRLSLLGVLLLLFSATGIAVADQPPDNLAFMNTYCKDAKTQAEMDGCAQRYATAAKATLNATWNAVLKTWQHYPLVLQRLEKSQHQWERYRDAEVAAQQAFYDEGQADAERHHKFYWPGTGKPFADATFHARLDEFRTAWLCSWLRGVWEGDKRHVHSCGALIKHPAIVPGS